ncbi:hypothetical protein KDH_77670 [Dictyobacter sp. S3.2.2.5]|uniref:Uncharacterized protein n=1 Tax=Dictyobacter halimunensis TaxID=3026934 RepID=A0ABQ6G535_9CHLR|nr:hypothetical protein KDH_77670 [Dictyobacter sp. S3.2.2.5]
MLKEGICNLFKPESCKVKWGGKQGEIGGGLRHTRKLAFLGASALFISSHMSEAR